MWSLREKLSLFRHFRQGGSGLRRGHLDEPFEGKRRTLLLRLRL
jgi:hypothetical protein